MTTACEYRLDIATFCKVYIPNTEESEYRLYGEDGFIPSRDRWRELRHSIDRFYEQHSDMAIENHNLRKQIENTERWKFPDETPPPPVLPKPGFIYVLRASNGPYKIGKSKAPTTRIKALQNASPVPLTLLFLFETPNMRDTETELHTMFESQLISNEWFELTDNDLRSIADYMQNMEVEQCLSK